MNRTFQKFLDESNPKSNKIWIDIIYEDKKIDEEDIII